MATITGSTNNSHYTLTCEYSYTQNTSANTSTITAIVYLAGNGYTTSSSYWCCTINGTEVTTNKKADINAKTELGRRTWTVNHNSDGTAKVNISFSFSNRVTAGTYTVSSGSGSASVALTTIPRASSMSLNRSSATIGSDSVTVNISRASSNFTHKVKVAWGGTWYLLAENVATSYSFTPPMSYCNTIPNATSGTATVKVETISNGSWIGEATKTITFNVPTSVVPSVGISVTANNTLSGTNIANKTTFTVKPTNATGSYGSTIKSYQLSGGFLNSTSSSGATTGTLGAGDYTLTVKVTDSRGRTATASKKVTVYPYDKPTVKASVYRCSQDGTKDGSGTYVRASVTYEVSNPNGGNANAKQYAVWWRNKGATSWTVLTNFTNLSAYSGTVTLDLGGGWDVSKSYDISIGIKDSYNQTDYYGTISTKSALLNLEKNGVGIGKIWEQGALDVGGQLHTTNGIYSGNSVFIKADPNGNVRFGYEASTTDAFIANSANNWLRLKADKTMTYAGYKVYTSYQKPTASEVGAVALDGDSTGNPKLIGSVGVRNSSNTSASAYMTYINNVPCIRYGGTGAGSNSGFAIIGSGDSTKFKVDDAGTAWVTAVRFDQPYGANYITKGTGDGNTYETYNIKFRTHNSLGFTANDDSVTVLVQGRQGRIMGKNAYYVSCSRALKSDIRAVVSDKEPMVANLARNETVDTNVTTENVCDFLDNVGVRTYITDFNQKGVHQEDVDNDNGHCLCLGYIADEMAKHPMFKYIGEETADGLHAINTNALTTVLIVGYQQEKKERLKLERKVEILETRLEELKELVAQPTTL